jgi:CBS domain containing-hemolysin-like protein
VTTVLKALLIAGLVALNALFVAAEYALLSVRRTRLEQLVREGDARARLAQSLLADVGLLFSGTQLGITVASLLMGWLGENIMSAALEQVLEGRLHPYVSLVIAHFISVGAAFLLVTSILMVLGELVPKTLAYERAEAVALFVARPLTLFFKLSRMPVRALDALAERVLRGLDRAPGRSHRAPHTPEEVKLIVSGIRMRGLLDQEQEEMIHSVFDLHRVLVREIMVPWPKITGLHLTQNLPALLDQIVKDQHSRIPIYKGAPDQVVGILYTKDLLSVLLERQRTGVALDAPFDLATLLHKPMIVPETMPLNQMLDEARKRHAQMALVVDEFATFVGLVTIEDVLEQIVGEIQDEYDREEKGIQRVSDNVLLVDASLGLRELADNYDISLPRGSGYETLAGFVLDRLGQIPRGGESFVFDGRRYTVSEVERRRVSKVKVEKLGTRDSGSGIHEAPGSTLPTAETQRHRRNAERGRRNDE